jgi:prepilin-type N-terminal cleavage/methylation domain-containing protein
MIEPSKGLNRRKDRGFSLVELLIVVGVLAIIFAIAVPHLLSTRSSAQASSAKGDLKTLHSAEVAYLAGAGHGQYGTLPQLEALNLLPAGFSSGDTTYTRFNYTCTLTLGTGNGTFSISCIPPLINQSTPALFLDDSGAIRYSATAAADSSSTPVGQ